MSQNLLINYFLNKGRKEMKKITEITRYNDPMLRIRLPQAIHQAVVESAKANKRRTQDQFIKSLIETFKNEERYSEIFLNILPDLKKIYSMIKTKSTDLKKYAQIISADLLNVLKEAAQKREVSLEIEVALRLLATIKNPELSGDNSILSQIMNKKFTPSEATAECKRKRKSAHYLYEIEKLRLFLHFENSLPRNFKEDFIVIDVKEATKKIKAELEDKEKDT